MNAIPLPEYEATPLDHISQGIVGLRVLFVNVYAISGNAGGWTLIDAGLPLSADRIERWAHRHFGVDDARPDGILLTHGHFDHVGALETLAARWNVPVYAHELELPYLTGEQSYPPPDPTVGGGLMAMMSSLYPRGPIDVRPRIQALPPGGRVPGLPGWRWIETPGHTVGHISLFHPDDRVLLAGDAFCTTTQESFMAVATQRPEMHGPPAYYTPDWDAARDSVQRLAALDPAIVAPGHGLPMSGPETASALRRLATDFDRIARPAEGRYVEHPVRN